MAEAEAAAAVAGKDSLHIRTRNGHTIIYRCRQQNNHVFTTTTINRRISHLKQICHQICWIFRNKVHRPIHRSGIKMRHYFGSYVNFSRKFGRHSFSYSVRFVFVQWENLTTNMMCHTEWVILTNIKSNRRSWTELVGCKILLKLNPNAIYSLNNVFFVFVYFSFNFHYRFVAVGHLVQAMLKRRSAAIMVIFQIFCHRVVAQAIVHHLMRMQSNVLRFKSAIWMRPSKKTI